jgi:predicted nucleic acid-binding protein
MTVTLNLPPEVERAFQAEAETRGLSLDEFLSELILLRAEHLSAQLVREEDVPVLRTGQPIQISVVDETLDRIRRDRDRTVLGLSNWSYFSILPFWFRFFWLNIPITLRASAFTRGATWMSRSAPLIACAEVYSTLTRLPLPLRATPDQAIEFLESIHGHFGLVSLESEDYLDSIRNAAANRVAGGAIYDALIARCAIRAGADQIFTWNTRHYELLGAEVSKRVQIPALG